MSRLQAGEVLHARKALEAGTAAEAGEAPEEREMEGGARWSSPWRWGLVAVGVGAVLRFFGIRWGFPHHFHPDENMMIIVLDRIGRGHLNPEFFAYGSLPLYMVRGLVGFSAAVTRAPVDPYLVGRIAAALSGTVTLLVLFLLGKRIYGDRAAIFATLLLAVTVLHVQLSHFYTVDIFLTLIVVACLLAAWRCAQEGDLFSYLATGALLGLGGATKGAAVFLLPPILLAHWFGPGNRNRRRWSYAVLLAAAALVFFFLAQPYAILDVGHFLRDLNEQRRMVTGVGDFPYTRQYAGTIPYLYQVGNTLAWGLGLPLELLAILGCGLAAARALRRGGAWGDRFLLSFVIPSFLVVGFLHTKHMRYLAPIVPFLCLFAGRLVDESIERLQARTWRMTAVVLAAVLFGLTALYALAFSRIYLVPSTRTAATEWIAANAGPRATILIEHWDDRVPVDAPEGRYEFIELPLYEPDTEEKIAGLAGALAGGDYLVLASNRLYGSILRNEERYPVTSSYYRLLFGERLGYRLARTFVSYPGIFGVTLRDDLADESFTVYDHPKVLVFERVEPLSAGELLTRLEAPPEDVRSASISDLHRLSRAGLPRPGPDPVSLKILWWWLLVAALGIAAAPFGIVIFRRLEDAGIAFWRPIGILATSVLVWLGASTGIMRFTRGSAAGALALVAVLGLWLAAVRRDLVLAALRRWRRLLETEAVFLAVFLGFLLVRANNPNIHDPVGHGYCGGGEAMDLAFLNSLTRADSFPFYDPWLAGHTINYYYFGHLVSAVLTRLSGLRTALTFNLLVALFAALTVAGAFSIACNMTGRRGAGLFAGASVGLLGNFDGVLQVLGNLKTVAAQPMWRDALARTARSGIGLFPFDFWRSSRIIPNTVNEFPYFSFLFADLHAHMMAIPFTVLVIALGLALISSRGRGWEFGRGVEGGVAFVVSAMAVGALLAINPWNYPTGVTLFAIVIFMGRGWGSEAGAPVDGRRAALGRWIGALVRMRLSILALGITSLLLFLPFHLTFVPRSREVAFVHYHTELRYFVIIFGLFAYIIGTYLVLAWARTSTRRRRTAALLVALVLGLVIFLWIRHWGAALIGSSIVIAWWIIFRSPEMDARDRYGLMLILVGLLLIFVPEVVHVVDFNGRGELARFNTVFKLHIQAWVFLGIGAAWALIRLGRAARSLPGPVRRAWSALLVLLVAGAAIYPVAGTLAKCSLASGFRRPTLDGVAFMERSKPGDYGAIRWLERRTRGAPLVLEATGEGYNTWYSRISIFTGLPTLLGWGWHEYQWRYSDELIQRRERLVGELYTGQDEVRAAALIEDLGIDYVVVGDLERSRYGLAGLGKFGRLMDLVYAEEGTSLFRRRGVVEGAGAHAAEPRLGMEAYDAAARNMFVGGRGSGPGEFIEPRGAAPDGEGGVYILDFGNGRVQHFDRAGRFLYAWGRSGTGEGEFDDPCGIATDRQGYVYVADTWNGRIQKFDPLGACLAVWTVGGLGLYGPRGLAVDGEGRVYVADTGNHRVVVLDREGRAERSWGSMGNAPGEFIHPTDVAIDGQGRVLVADAGNSRVQAFTPEGALRDLWEVGGWREEVYNEPCVVTETEMAMAAGGADEDAGERGEGDRGERGSRGFGRRGSGSERVYLTDPVNHRLLCYTVRGEMVGSVAREGAGPSEFRYPIGVAPDGAGKLFVVDCLNHRVQRIDPSELDPKR
jgi:YYY domain-containing protein